MSPKQRAQILARMARVNAMTSVNEPRAETDSGVNEPKARSRDRHRPGYMAAYMRAWRAKRT